MKRFIERLFCKHDWKIERYLYGDIRNHFSRVERCSKCDKERWI